MSKGLLAEFGPERIRDTPLSESTFVGAGIGAALGGMRPIVEVMTVNFSLLALDQIVNNAATIRHMSGGQFSIPLVIRMATGAGRQLAAQHAHSLEGWYAHIPGHPHRRAGDARGCARHAVDGARGSRSGPHLRASDAVQHGRAAGRRCRRRSTSIARRSAAPGKDVSLITYGGTLGKTLQAAETLAGEGIDAEVIDLRTLAPARHADDPGRRCKKTHRAVIVDEGWRSGSLSAEIMRAPRRAGVLRSRRADRARLQRRSADSLSQAPRRRRAAPAAGDRRGGARSRGSPWLSSGCRRSAPTWRPARSSSG